VTDRSFPLKAYDDLRKRNPRLIYVSIGGYQKNRNCAGRFSDDVLISALSGQVSVTGRRGRKPLPLHPNQVHYATSLYLSLAILLAFRRKLKEKRGVVLDLSVEECAISVLEDALR